MPLSGRERRGLVVLAGVLVAAGAGIGGWELAAGNGVPAGQGQCVSVFVASSTGGGELRHCGQDAQKWCAAEASATGPLASQVRTACRRAGLPVPQ